jgi:tripartite-type tricarboxylate transporter receptor subunit TctC
MIGPASGGAIRLIAIASPDRSPMAPGVPTAAEAGFPVLAFPGGHGLFAPREMPSPLRARIAEEVRLALGEPELAQRIANFGLLRRAGGAKEFETLLLAERARWTEIAARYGVRPPA